jgi:hypothetical protein
MQVSSLFQYQSILQYLQAQSYASQKSPAVQAGEQLDSAEPAARQSATSSYDLSFSYEYAVRIQMESSAQLAEDRESMPPEIEDPRSGHHGRRVSRRAWHKGPTQVLKTLDKEVERALRQFVKENHDLLDEDIRHDIKELRRDFRHDLMSAFRSGFTGHRLDLGSVSQGIQQAFANLIGGLETIAGELHGEEVDQAQQIQASALPAPGEGIIIPTEIGGTASAMDTQGAISQSEAQAAQAETSTCIDGGSFVRSATYRVVAAVQVSFSASISIVTDSADGVGQRLSGRLGNLLSGFSENLADLLRSADESESNIAGFLSDLGLALDRLAEDLQGLIDENPGLPEDDTPQDLPLQPQVIPYDPVVSEHQNTTDRLELIA